ncbi:high-potential iron-sulfur protein [Oleiagrimonas sp. C23AA]|uniref:high-potential iron-sulfur protein n=1 Tax=Oleiagrimonas sp. C23AA TaxID=2719047 RepID=UPI001420678F|nr:high-potential iron-sulfur protein [Oleiagrimonas sp. C23AA]NII10349.1 twin-arginine translocation signal domain-containing protein [Oleiagrimonas sp. C23AA]
MTQHDENIASRRRFLKLAAGSAAVAAAAGVMPGLARARDLPHVSPSDATAKALHYVEDASKSDSPKHKAGDDCANCMFYQGKAGQAYGPCQLFPGKAVNAKGWCISHQPKK